MFLILVAWWNRFEVWIRSHISPNFPFHLRIRPWLGPLFFLHIICQVSSKDLINNHSMFNPQRQQFYYPSCHHQYSEPSPTSLSLGSYIEELLPVMVARKKTVDVLKFLADMTKSNATYIDTQLLCAVFRECYYPNKKQRIEEVSTQ